MEHLNVAKEYTADEILTLQREEKKKVIRIVYLWIAILSLIFVMFSFVIIKYTYIDERLVYLFYLTTKNGCITFK